MVRQVIRIYIFFSTNSQHMCLLRDENMFSTRDQDMGWLRLVGSLKIQVYFAEDSLFYRALLQKRPVILRSLLIVATPYFPIYPLTLYKWFQQVIQITWSIFLQMGSHGTIGFLHIYICTTRFCENSGVKSMYYFIYASFKAEIEDELIK